VPGGDQIARLVEANWGSRPVYILGNPKDPGFAERYDAQRAGFALRLRPKGTAPNQYEIVEQKLDLFKAMRFPDRRYPETTFESGLVQSYGRLAFDIGYVLDDGVRDAEAIPYYQTSLRLDPTSSATYKNLGLLLANRGAPASEVAPLWEEFLRREPNDPQAPAIRDRLRQMGRPQ
jgi:hypothetical protein